MARIVIDMPAGVPFRELEKLIAEFADKQGCKMSNERPQLGGDYFRLERRYQTLQQPLTAA